MNTLTKTPVRITIALLVSVLLVSACSGSSEQIPDASGVANMDVGPASTEQSTNGESNTMNEGSTESASADVTLTEVLANLELVADKTFRLSWQPVSGATYYRILENPDGVSGFTQIGTDLEPSINSFDHRVALYRRVNARYIVQACNTRACVDSDEQIVAGTLENAITYIKASNTGPDDYFGFDVSISADGTTLVVGAYREGSSASGVNGDETDNAASDPIQGYLNGAGAGAVYVFERSGGAWQRQAYLKASNTGLSDLFGKAVAVSANGNTLAVGAPGEGSAASGINGDQKDDSAISSGAVYLFTRTNTISGTSGNWQQQAYIKASNTDAKDGFGDAVSLSADGGVLAVGASSERSTATGVNGNQDINGFPSGGAVYVFASSNGNWQQQAYLKPSNTGVADDFGLTLSLSADSSTLVVGAPREESRATGINGDQYDKGIYAGAAYVFVQSNGEWQQQAYLKASNTDRGDYFGDAVSLSADGNTLAVSAPSEDGSGRGVNADQSDNNNSSAGAVYLFVRSSGNWEQQAYIKASNTDSFSDFGTDVSLSADGDTLAVGASKEGSVTTGINGNQNDDTASESGAAYVFVRQGETWQQNAYLKASNSEGRDQFGSSLSISADGVTLAVGAPSEDSAATGINGFQGDNSATRSGAVYLY